MSWRIEEELARLSGGSTISESLLQLQIITAGEEVISLATIKDWYRSGAETFLYHFEVRCASGAAIPLVLKAYVPFVPAPLLSQKHDELLKRRQLLSSRQISVPKLYASAAAMVLEEFIAWELSEWMQTASQTERSSMTAKLNELARCLDNLGFAPITLYPDLRTNGQEPYIVDFGEDLGPAGVSTDKNYNQTALDRWLKTLPISH